LLSSIASRKHAAFVARYEALRQGAIMRSRRWLRVKANLLCGSFTPATGDLFGDPVPAPVWRRQEDPLTRLISFATDPETPTRRNVGGERSAGNVSGDRAFGRDAGPIVSRPIGMLMLVPRDAL
jgi:hypothetical protein